MKHKGIGAWFTNRRKRASLSRSSALTCSACRRAARASSIRFSAARRTRPSKRWRPATRRSARRSAAPASRWPAGFPRSVGHLPFKFGIELAELLLRLLAIGDVDAGADPLSDTAVVVEHGDAAGQEIAVNPVVPAEAVLGGVVRSGFDRTFQTAAVCSRSSGCRALDQPHPRISSTLWPVNFRQAGMSSTTRPWASVVQPTWPVTSRNER